MQLPTLPPAPTLGDLQAYQHALCHARGWDKATELETFLLLAEEVGELAKAIRKHKALYIESGTQGGDTRAALAHEFSDVLSYLLELANQFGIDLEQAFRDKEALNAGRVWDHPGA